MYQFEKRIARILRDLKKEITPRSRPVGGYKWLKTEETGFEKTPYDGLDWPQMESGVWRADKCHRWLAAQVEIPPELAGGRVDFELETGREGSWDASNPQIEAYVDGEMARGLDVNHRSLTLSRKAAAGEKHTLALRFYDGGADFYVLFQSRLCAVDEEVLALYYDMAVPYDVATRLGENDKNRIDILTSLNEAVNLLDLRIPSSPEFRASVARAREYMAGEFYGKLCGRSEAEVWCVGHTHIDVAWLWTLAVTREKAYRSFSTVLDLMKQYPEYVFMSSQPQLYEYVKERSPQVYAQIGERVKQGRWEPEGGMWLEADCNLSSGEALVRQFLYGKKFFRTEFGADSEILWLPDAFGFTAALPQIMKKCGVRYFMTTKISWNEKNRFPYDTFVWKGLDGTGVLTHFVCATEEKNAETGIGTTYNGTIDASQVMGAWKRYQQKNLNNKVLMSYGFGDGGGGPTAEMLETQRRLARGIPGCPKTVMATSGSYFRTLEKEVGGNRFLPEWNGELYLEYHRGTYTGMARNKKYNRRSEFLMGNAEWLASADLLLNGTPYPRRAIDENWIVLLRNQFHDILPGSAIKEVYDDSRAEYEKLAADVGGLVRKAEDDIVSRVDAKEPGVAVFNPLGFDSDGVVTFRVPDSCGRPAVREANADGSVTLHPCQRIGGGEAVFHADHVPAKGWKLFALRDTAVPQPAALRVSAGEMENAFFRVLLDEKGEFTSIWDKRAGREVVPAGKKANTLVAYEDKPCDFDDWNVDNWYREKSWPVDDAESVEVVESGPVRIAVRVTRRFSRSKIVQTIRMYRDVPRIDVECHADWDESNVFLRVLFPVDVHAGEATYDVQFGNLTRPAHYNTSWDETRYEVCAHKWMDFSEDGYGVSVLNDCKYGCDVHNGVMGLSLIKCGTDPNPRADREAHDFVYSVYPHAGGWRQAGTVREAYRLNNGLRAAVVPAHPGSLPEEFSFVSCRAENVVLETVKAAEDGRGFVVRLYECFNRRGVASLVFPKEIARAAECDMLENETAELPADGRELPFRILPYEVKTFRVELK